MVNGTLSMFWVENILYWRKTRDLRSYFAHQKNRKKKSQTGIPELVKATGNVAAAVLTANAELGSFNNKKEERALTSIPSLVKEEVDIYAYNNRIQTPINRYKPKFPQYTFLHISINNCKLKAQ